MSNQIPQFKRFHKKSLTRALVAGLICSGTFFESPIPTVAADPQRITLSLPGQIRSGQDFRISILFSSRPRPHHFFRLEVDVDGNPAALADMSRGKQTEVTVPPLKAGTHIVRVIWKNAPDHRPVTIEKPIVVVGSTALSKGVTP